METPINLPDGYEVYPRDLAAIHGAQEGMKYWHVAENAWCDYPADCLLAEFMFTQWHFALPLGTIAALTTPLPEPVCDCGSTAHCTLCSKTESKGFYTGCMVKDGNDQNSGWACDGNGNLTRPHSPSCSIHRRYRRILPAELAGMKEKPEELICCHSKSDVAIWGQVTVWPIPDKFPQGFASSEYAYAVPLEPLPTTEKQCALCTGTGIAEGVKCPRCDGTGKYLSVRFPDPGWLHSTLSHEAAPAEGPTPEGGATREHDDCPNCGAKKHEARCWNCFHEPKTLEQLVEKRANRPLPAPATEPGTVDAFLLSMEKRGEIKDGKLSFAGFLYFQRFARRLESERNAARARVAEVERRNENQAVTISGCQNEYSKVWKENETLRARISSALTQLEAGHVAWVKATLKG